MAGGSRYFCSSSSCFATLGARGCILPPDSPFVGPLKSILFFPLADLVIWGTGVILIMSMCTLCPQVALLQAEDCSVVVFAHSDTTLPLEP